MLETGTITGRAIALNKDATRPTTILQVVVSGPDDVQSVELQSFAGEDYQPPNGSRVFIADVSDTFRVALVVDDGIEPAADLSPGERELYSSAGGVRKAKIRLLADGTIKVNDGTDYAVAFNDLKTEFNKLNTAFNTHTHVCAAPGVASATGLPQSAANIDLAKVSTVRLP